MSDIAKAAGVSQQTVSAVLNGRKHCYASDATRKNILDAVAKLGYIPNQIARSLRGMPSGVIGIIDAITDVEIHNELVSLISSKLWQKGFRVMLCDSGGDPGREENILKEFISWNVEGVIYYNFNEDLPKSGYLSRIPHVFISFSEGENVVAVDRRKGGQMVARHLIECHGHDKIAFITTELYGSAGKYKGFLDAATGLKFNKRHFLVDEPDMEKLLSRTLQLHKKSGVTAFFASNDYLAAFIMRSFIDMGIRIPDDVAVIGFDGLGYGEFLRPSLTTVRQPVEKIADIAVATLVKKIKSKDKSVKSKNCLLVPELLIRESCGCGKGK